LSQALNSLSTSPQPIKNFQIFFNENSPETLQSQLNQQHNEQLHDMISKSFNPLIYGNDVDSVDIATRITMVQFLNSKNILANFNEHTRTLRLYPRPVVAFQYNSFIRSRPIKSNFIIKLAKTQAIEYLAEWSLYPTNVSYLRIQTGVFDPSLIGDKPKWYCRNLNPIQFKTYNENTTLSAAIANYNLCKQNSINTSSIQKLPIEAVDQDSGPSTDNDDNDVTDDTAYLATQLPSQASITVDVNILTTINQATTMCVDVHSVYQPPFKFINLDANGNENEADDVYSNDDKNSLSIKSSFDYGSSASFTTSSSSSSVGEAHAKTMPDIQPLPEQDSKSSSVTTIAPMSKTFTFEITSNDDLTKQHSKIESKSQPDSPTTPIVIQNNQSQKMKQQSLIQQLSEDLNDVTNKAMRKVGSLLSDSAQQDMGQSQTTPKRTMPMTHKTSSSSTLAIAHGGSESMSDSVQSIRSQKNSQQLEINNDNQQFLKEVLQHVLDGQGIGWLKYNRFKRLMEDENFRNFVLSRLNTALDRKLLNDEEHIEDVFIKDKNVFKGMCKLLSTIVQGLEHTYANNGIGGMASAFQLLEIVHTHYHLRDKSNRNAQESSPIENVSFHENLNQIECATVQTPSASLHNINRTYNTSQRAIESPANGNNQASLVTQLGTVCSYLLSHWAFLAYLACIDRHPIFIFN
jgi:hypothetical protein